MIAHVLRRSIANIKASTFRQIHISLTANSAESSPLYKLRQKTGIAYSLCREALNKHDNDLNQAEAWLKAQALALGLQKATKVRGRSTREGLVGLAIHSNNRIATVVELNCETDFVAKNDIFKDLALDLTHQIATIQDGCDREQVSENNSVEKLTLTETQLKVLDSQIVPIITKLGENIRIQRAAHFQVTQDALQLFGQIHSKNGQREANNLEMITGRFGAIVALENLQDSGRSLKAYGNRLCQHVIGYSPTYIELPEAVRKHLEEAAKERRKIESEAENEKDAEYNSDHEGQEEASIGDDWPSIMDQRIIMSDHQSVRDFCKENDFSIVYFNRFECGCD